MACGQAFVSPQPNDAALARIYSADYFLDSAPPNQAPQISQVKLQTAGLYLDALAAYGASRSGMLLDVGCGNGELLLAASRHGFDVRGLDVSPYAVEKANALLERKVATCSTIESAPFPDHQFEVCICADVIEHTREPNEFLSDVHRLLKPGGVLLLVTPALDSWQARFMNGNWHEFKTEHLHYFSRPTLGNALARSGFASIELLPASKRLTLDYVNRHFTRFPVPVWSAVLNGITSILPASVQNASVRVPTGGAMALARAAVKRPRPLVSVIVPVYNEAATVTRLLESVTAKTLDGADKEVIIVESNSNDGSRDAVQQFRDAPGVSIVLQDRPRGKGFAVREGLRHAAGDFILIQDADLEYDVDDYDALIEPLRTYRQAVVLGSRHAGNAAIRSYANQLWLGVVINAGHVLLTALFNFCYRQSLKDPWTMYKVFRRDCLHGLRFECNRFDFDVELLAKLIRKGYAPAEIQVRYSSRSFREGKKIHMWRDPWTWVWACLKFRVVSPFGSSQSRGQ